MNVAHKSIDLTNDKRNYNKTAGYMQAEIDELEKMIESGFEGLRSLIFAITLIIIWILIEIDL